MDLVNRSADHTPGRYRFCEQGDRSMLPMDWDGCWPVGWQTGCVQVDSSPPPLKRWATRPGDDACVTEVPTMWRARLLILLIVSGVSLDCGWTPVGPTAAGPGASGATPTGESDGRLAHQMKGYELYCWQQDGQHRFTLLIGTNRDKTPAEVFGSPDITLLNERGAPVDQGVTLDATLTEIGRLPSGEFLVVYPVRYPPSDELEYIRLPEDVAHALRSKAEELGLYLLGLP